MANPVIVKCPAGAWTKVATAVKTGNGYFNGGDFKSCLVTQRATGEAAPADTVDGVPITDGRLEIAFSADTDVYVYPMGKPAQLAVWL